MKTLEVKVTEKKENFQKHTWLPPQLSGTCEQMAPIDYVIDCCFLQFPFSHSYFSKETAKF